MGPRVSFGPYNLANEDKIPIMSKKPESTKKRGRKGYNSAVNDIGPENEGDEGYFSSDPDSDNEPIKKGKQGKQGKQGEQGSRYDNPDDAIPAQGLFLMRARHRLACVDVVSPANRGKTICDFFTFILRPAYAPLHRAYDEWRISIHKKCDEFLAETTAAEVRALCERFKAEFPVV